jgi:ribulose-5-phosphate 4-epimerase/fuculose-1-phosphate aldolase
MNGSKAMSDIRMKTQKANVTSFPMTQEEKIARRDLAAAYRLFAHFEMDDLLANHLTVRVPGPGGSEAFLINPLGLLFDEVTASSLIKINTHGEVLQETPWAVNKAGFVIHSAIHEGCPHAKSVMHLHGQAGTAVSALKEGLLPLNQTAIAISASIAFHDYEGPATNEEEKVRLQRDLGDKRLMMLRNHGTLSIGETVAEAFFRLHSLETACQVQVKTLSMGRPLYDADRDVIIKTQKTFGNDEKSLEFIRSYCRDLFWPAMLRRLDKVNPGYDDL